MILSDFHPSRQGGSPILQSAITYTRQGIPVIPVKPNKQPDLASWKQFQTRIMRLDEVQKLFNRSSGLAIVCGLDGLETLDFDQPLAYDQFVAAVEADAPDLFESLTISQTPSGGHHLRYRSSAVEGNQVLARSQDGRVRIETRGVGGYAIAPPGIGYHWVQGDQDTIPTISAEQRDYLLLTARSLCLAPKKVGEKPISGGVSRAKGQRVGDLYNQSHQYRQLMEELNFRLSRTYPDKEYWVWADARGQNNSITFFTQDRNFYVHTTGLSGVEAGQSYTPFGLLTNLKFNGHYSEAIAYLKQINPHWVQETNPQKVSGLERKVRTSIMSDPSVISLIKWTPGTGKTYWAQQVAVEQAKDGKTTAFLMQSNQRAQQEAEAMQDRFGYQPLVIKGRGKDNCDYHQQAEDLGQSGYSVIDNLCRSCQYRAGCQETGYLSQKRKEAKITLMSFESFVESAKDFDYVIWDENPDRIALKEHQLTSYRLEKILNAGPHSPELEAVLELISQLVMAAGLKGQALNDWQLQQTAIRQILDHFQDKSRSLQALAEEPDTALEVAKTSLKQLKLNYRTVGQIEQVAPRWMIDLIQEIQRLIKTTKPINTRLVVTQDRIIFRQKRTINSQAKMVILDAYGRPELYQQIFARPVVVDDHRIEPDWTVHHIPINTSRTRMMDQRIWGDDKWRELISTLSIMVEFERMVVFVDKDKVEKARQAVEDLGLEDKISLDYVYKGRGTNQYQDYDAIAIVSQAEPNPASLVSQARALYGDLEYINDQPEANNKRKFQDKRLQEYKESKQIDELVQTAYRIRPATQSHPLGKKLILCTSSEIGGLTDGNKVIKHGRRLNQIKTQLHRQRLKKAMQELTQLGGYLILAKGLNQELAKMVEESQSQSKFPDFSYNIYKDITL